VQPAIVVAAQGERRRWERERNVLRGFQLVLLFAAAILGLIFASLSGSISQAFAVVAALAFIGSILIEAYAATNTLDERAVDAATLFHALDCAAWRYAVGGHPFGIEELPPDQAAAELADAIQELRHRFPRLSISPQPGQAGLVPEITRAIRAEARAIRKQLYAEQRLAAEQSHYATLAAQFRGAERRWRLGAFGVQGLGAIAAIIAAAGYVHVDLLSVIAAGGVAVGSWMNVRRHAARHARASEMANLLSEFGASMDVLIQESEWAAFVDQVESELAEAERF
jgi:hypothetical protein